MRAQGLNLRPLCVYPLPIMTRATNEARTANRLRNEVVRGRVEPDALLRRRAFVRVAFFRHFIELINNLCFENPREALRWALVAPGLGLRIGPSPHCYGQISLANTYRVNGAHRKSEQLFREALANARTIEQEASALWQSAWLRVCQGRVQESLSQASASVDLLRHSNRENPLLLGQCLLSLGYSQSCAGLFHEAFQSFSEALMLAGRPGNDAERRLHFSATHNLATLVSESGGWSRQAKALILLRSARRQLTGSRYSAAAYRLQWLEGLINYRLCHYERSFECLERAFTNFLKVELRWPAAMAGIDLCATSFRLFERGKMKWASVAEISAKVRSLLVLSDDPNLRIYGNWLESLDRAWSDSMLRDCREALKVKILSSNSFKARRPPS